MIVLQLLLGIVALAPLTARQPSAPATKVSHWDACSVGPLPWQGIACLDIDSQATVKHGLKPWVDKARALPIAAGVWQLPGGRGESDLGGQRLIEAPDGLILIEAHAGLSFESEWAAIKAIGLDPMRVKYVLATHEHGDHAPGAYL